MTCVSPPWVSRAAYEAFRCKSRQFISRPRPVPPFFLDMGASFRGIAEALLREGIPIRFEVDGTSMLPGIHPGDVVTVKPLDQQINPGAVLLADCDGRLLLHRLVQIDARLGRDVRLTCKADARDQLDLPVGIGAVWGQLSAIESSAWKRAVSSTTRKLRRVLDHAVAACLAL